MSRVGGDIWDDRVEIEYRHIPADERRWEDVEQDITEEYRHRQRQRWQAVRTFDLCIFLKRTARTGPTRPSSTTASSEMAGPSQT